MPEHVETVVLHLGDAKMAIVAFIFACIVFPRFVKNRHQFYMAVVAVLGGMFFQMLAAMVGSIAFGRVCTVFNIVLDMFAIVLLILAAGGLSAQELASGVGEAFDAMKKGGKEEDSTVIPIEGQVRKAPPKSGARKDDDDGRTVYVIDDDLAKPAQPAAPAKAKDTGPIPLD